MKKIIVTLLLSAFINTVNAQITFQKSYGGSGTEGRSMVVKTSDGGYAITSYSDSAGLGYINAYLVRTDGNGTLLWNKTYGGFATDVGRSIAQTYDNGFIIAGSTISFSPSNYDVYLIRTDMNGDTLWSKTYGSSTFLNEDAWNILQTVDSGFIITAHWASTSYTYLIKTNNIGDTLWTRIYDAGDAFSIIQNPDKGFTICGTAYSFISNSVDMYITRMDSLGNIAWYKTYGGNITEYGNQIIKANDGGYIAIGYTSSFGAGSDDVYIVKTDSMGGLLWSKTYGSGTVEEGSSIVSTGDGYALAGWSSVFGTNYEGLLMKIDNQGNLTWAKNYWYSGSLTSIQQTADKGFILSGTTTDCFLVKTDSLGNSGCSDSSNTSLIVSVAPVQVDTIALNRLYGQTIIGSPATAISSGGTSSTFCFTTGIEEQTAAHSSAITVFPNPATDIVTIISDKTFGQINRIEFYNLYGQCVLSSALTDKINIASLSSGIYFIKVTNNSGMMRTARLEKLV